MHIYVYSMTFWIRTKKKFTKFCWAVSEELRWQTFSEVFHFRQIYIISSKGRKLTGKKISCKYAHLHIIYMYFITTKFHQILLSSVIGVALTLFFISAKFLSSKGALLPGNNQSTCADKKKGLTRARTDLADGTKLIYPPQLVSWCLFPLIVTIQCWWTLNLSGRWTLSITWNLAIYRYIINGQQLQIQ